MKLIPLWVLVYGILAWFLAEILTGTTNLAKIDLGTFISFSLYIVQILIVADIVVRRKLPIIGIWFVGLIFGLIEETFFIKNPLPQNLIFALGHSIITVTIPFIFIKFLFRKRLQPFLSRKGYVIAILYLAAIYILMAFLLPFIYLDAILVSFILITILVLFVNRLK